MCMLNEVLLWVTFRRLPVAIRSPEEGREVREAERDMAAHYGYTGHAGYTGDLSDWESFLEDGECAAVGLPPDPRMAALREEEKYATGNWEDENEVEDEDASELDKEDWKPNWDYDPAVELKREMEAWTPKYQSAIEYPASRIYVALREGRLAASGKLLPDHDRDKALAILESQDKDICDLDTFDIPASFWSLQGIDWWSNAARNDQEHYCWIRCRTEQVLKIFPAEDRVPLSGVEKIGENVVLHEPSQKPLDSARSRGRPPFHWDAFHLEVTDLLLKRALPEKKEAAIQYFQDWIVRVLKQHPKRTAIGDKLKPYYDRYYDRFIKSPDGN